MSRLVAILTPALLLAACHTAQPLPEKVDPPKQPRSSGMVAPPAGPGTAATR